MLADLALPFQRWVYEATELLGPVWSAVSAGFAVVFWDQVYLTPAGEAYLADLEQEQCE